MNRRRRWDNAFNRAVHAEIEGSTPSERVVFIDTDNKVREVVYPSGFHTGDLQHVRARLEKQGVLKGVVHISAAVLGSPGGHGPRTSIVEYLPDGTYHAFQWQPPVALPVDMDEEALANTQRLFSEGEEKPDE